MKKLIAILAVLLVLGSGLVIEAQAPAGDDLSAALTNHGVDPGLSVPLAAALEVYIANANALQARIAADESTISSLSAAVSTLQTQVAVLQNSVPPTVPPSSAITVQAENYTSVFGSQAPAYPVTCGTTTCYSQAGETLTYTVSVPTAGNYQFAVSASSSAAGSITVNGTPVAIPNTGGFSIFTTTPGPVLALNAGTNTLTIVYVTAHINLDYYTLTPH